MCTTLITTVFDAKAYDNLEEIPYIGTARRILDNDGRQTQWFVPVVAEPRSQYLAPNGDLLGASSVSRYLSWLWTEKDPDVRRHYIHEVVRGATGVVDWIALEFISLLRAEREAEVRAAYVSALLSLAVLTELNDTTLIGIIQMLLEATQADPSRDVQVLAASALTWFGETRGISVLAEAIAGRFDVHPEIMRSIPGALQRLNTSHSFAMLQELATLAADDHLRLTAMWTAYQSGLAAATDVLDAASWVCRSSLSAKARAAAVSTMGALGADNPSLVYQVERAVAACMAIERDTTMRTLMQQLLDRLSGR